MLVIEIKISAFLLPTSGRFVSIVSLFVDQNVQILLITSAFRPGMTQHLLLTFILSLNSNSEFLHFFFL